MTKKQILIALITVFTAVLCLGIFILWENISYSKEQIKDTIKPITKIIPKSEEVIVETPQDEKIALPEESEKETVKMLPVQTPQTSLVKEVPVLTDLEKRLSLAIRLEPTGAYDYLLSDWEFKYFGCRLCHNIYWDTDGDELIDIVEFIAGTDPFKSSLKDVLNQDWRLAEFQRVNDLGGFEYIGDSRIRTPMLRSPITTISPNAVALLLTFSTSVSDGFIDSLLVYFNDELLYRYIGSTNGEQIDQDIDLSKVRGKEGRFFIVLRSHGPAGAQLNVQIRGLTQEVTIIE